jgi:hypothetical protein
VNSSSAPPSGPSGTSDTADVVAVVGEALLDLVPAGRAGLFEATPGGSPANVAVGLARLGVPARLLARIADDPLGRRIRAHLTGNGVDLSHTVPAQEPTSLAIVALGEGGVPEYDFRIQGTADWQWRDAELAGVLDGRLVALHAGSLALTMPPGAEVLARLVRRARQYVTVSYDPNCRPQLMGGPDTLRPRVEALVEAADLVKVSAEDPCLALARAAASAGGHGVADAWPRDCRGDARPRWGCGGLGGRDGPPPWTACCRCGHGRRGRRLHQRSPGRPAPSTPAWRPPACRPCHGGPRHTGRSARRGGPRGGDHLHPPRR